MNLKIRGNQNKNQNIYGINTRGSGAQWESAEDEYSESKIRKNAYENQSNLEIIREFRDMKTSV